MARKPGGKAPGHKSGHARTNHHGDDAATGRGSRYPLPSGRHPPRGSRFFFGTSAALQPTSLPVPKAVPAEMLFERPASSGGQSALSVIKNETLADWQGSGLSLRVDNRIPASLQAVSALRVTPVPAGCAEAVKEAKRLSGLLLERGNFTKELDVDLMAESNKLYALAIVLDSHTMGKEKADRDKRDNPPLGIVQTPRDRSVRQLHVVDTFGAHGLNNHPTGHFLLRTLRGEIPEIPAASVHRSVFHSFQRYWSLLCHTACHLPPPRTESGPHPPSFADRSSVLVSPVAAVLMRIEAFDTAVRVGYYRCMKNQEFPVDTIGLKVNRFPGLNSEPEGVKVEAKEEAEERRVVWKILPDDPLAQDRECDDVELIFTKPRKPTESVTEAFSTAANASDEPQFDPSQAVTSAQAPFELGLIEVDPLKNFPTSAPCACAPSVSRTCMHCAKMRKTLTRGLGGACGVLTEMLLSVQAMYPRVVALMEHYIDANHLMCDSCYFPKGGKKKKSKTECLCVQESKNYVPKNGEFLHTCKFFVLKSLGAQLEIMEAFLRCQPTFRGKVNFQEVKVIFAQQVVLTNAARDLNKWVGTLGLVFFEIATSGGEKLDEDFGKVVNPYIAMRLLNFILVLMRWTMCSLPETALDLIKVRFDRPLGDIARNDRLDLNLKVEEGFHNLRNAAEKFARNLDELCVKSTERAARLALTNLHRFETAAEFIAFRDADARRALWLRMFRQMLARLLELVEYLTFAPEKFRTAIFDIRCRSGSAVVALMERMTSELEAKSLILAEQIARLAREVKEDEKTPLCFVCGHAVKTSKVRCKVCGLRMCSEVCRVAVTPGHDLVCDAKAEVVLSNFFEVTPREFEEARKMVEDAFKREQERKTEKKK